MEEAPRFPARVRVHLRHGASGTRLLRSLCTNRAERGAPLRCAAAARVPRSIANDALAVGYSPEQGACLAGAATCSAAASACGGSPAEGHGAQ